MKTTMARAGKTRKREAATGNLHATELGCRNEKAYRIQYAIATPRVIHVPKETKRSVPRL